MTRTITIAGMATCFVLIAAAASAHVMLEPKTAKIGSTLRVSLNVGHGCAGAPTTRVRVKIPQGILGVVVEPKPGWEVNTVTAAYDEPYSHGGATVKEGITEVAWTGLLPPHEIGRFMLTFDISDSLTANQRVYFPVVQECQKAVVRWIDKSDDGDYPAPVLLLSAGH
jgi:uncharacterized protein YcnI